MPSGPLRPMSRTRPRRLLRWAIVLPSVLLTLLGGASAAARAQQPDPPPVIETVGTAERRLLPDRAVLLLQVEARAESASTAASEHARLLQRVRDTLRVLGLERETSHASYYVGPTFEPARPGSTGMQRLYVARSVLRVLLTRVDAVGGVIDAALARGATGVAGVQFEASSAARARREAIADAAAAARADAEALARAMGGTLGALVSTSTVSPNDPRQPMDGFARAAGIAGGTVMPTQITPSDIQVHVAVFARWRIRPGP